MYAPGVVVAVFATGETFGRDAGVPGDDAAVDVPPAFGRVRLLGSLVEAQPGDVLSRLMNDGRHRDPVRRAIAP